MTLTVRADPQGGSSVKHLFHRPQKQPLPTVGQTHRSPKTAKLAKLSVFCSSMYGRISIVCIPPSRRITSRGRPRAADVVNKPLKTRKFNDSLAEWRHCRQTPLHQYMRLWEASYDHRSCQSADRILSVFWRFLGLDGVPIMYIIKYKHAKPASSFYGRVVFRDGGV
jgi:hypothetical protein